MNKKSVSIGYKEQVLKNDKVQLSIDLKNCIVKIDKNNKYDYKNVFSKNDYYDKKLKFKWPKYCSIIIINYNMKSDFKISKIQ